MSSLRSESQAKTETQKAVSLSKSWSRILDIVLSTVGTGTVLPHLTNAPSTNSAYLTPSSGHTTESTSRALLSREPGADSGSHDLESQTAPHFVPQLPRSTGLLVPSSPRVGTYTERARHSHEGGLQNIHSSETEKHLH